MGGSLSIAPEIAQCSAQYGAGRSERNLLGSTAALTQARGHTPEHSTAIHSDAARPLSHRSPKCCLAFHVSKEEKSE